MGYFVESFEAKLSLVTDNLVQFKGFTVLYKMSNADVYIFFYLITKYSSNAAFLFTRI